MRSWKYKVPTHIAFIMDGNGRWANRRGLTRHFGHRVGYKKILGITKRAADLGITVVSVFAFSTENWNRPKQEIDEIFQTVRENLDTDMDQFNIHGIRVTTMGDLTRFPDDLRKKLDQVRVSTQKNSRCTLNLCINYGGRADILQAAKRLQVPNTEITEETFSKLLYGADLPNPDLVIRTSGEQRISNFMLWQMAYSELLFTKKFWPDVRPRFVDWAVKKYSKRKRRYGGC